MFGMAVMAFAGLVLVAAPAAACTVTVGDCVTGDDGQTDGSGTTQPSSPPPSGSQPSGGTSGPAPAPAPAPAPPAAHPAGESRLLELVNQERSSRGLPLLSLRTDAAGIARDHSFRMADAGTVFHNDAYFTAATRQALGASLLGENVAFNSSIDDAHARLMASPKHRENILDPRFNSVGMGVVRTSTGSHYVTQAFLRAGPAPAPVAAPTPKPAAPAAAPTSTAPAAVTDAALGDDDEPAVSLQTAKATAATEAAIVELPDGASGGLLGVAPIAEWAGGAGFAAGTALLGAAAAARRLARRAAVSAA